MPLFAVGEATAARARGEGFSDVYGAGGAVGDLVALVNGRLRPEVGRLLHIAGSLVAGDLSGALRARGFGWTAPCSTRRGRSLLERGDGPALAAGIVDFALFFSPRTAAIFADSPTRPILPTPCGASPRSRSAPPRTWRSTHCASGRGLLPRDPISPRCWPCSTGLCRSAAAHERPSGAYERRQFRRFRGAVCPSCG